MKKLLICLLLTPLSFISCKKNNADSSKAASYAFDVSTESAASRHVTLGAHNIITCQVKTDSSGGWSGHRHWQFYFGNESAAVNLSLEGDYPNDAIPINQDLTWSYRINQGGAKFWALYSEGNTMTHIGSDSAFVTLRISDYDGHKISGAFSFSIYDPGKWAKINNGQFGAVPVIIIK
jgi:hypothetical protein